MSSEPRSRSPEPEPKKLSKAYYRQKEADELEAERETLFKEIVALAAAAAAEAAHQGRLQAAAALEAAHQGKLQQVDLVTVHSSPSPIKNEEEEEYVHGKMASPVR